MMRIDIISLFPEMFQALNFGIVGRALRSDLLNLHFWNPRDFTNDPHRTVDDRPYGGGPGMVMKYEPLVKCIQNAQKDQSIKARVILMSPQGTPLDQAMADSLSKLPRLMLIAGRYEGIDERIIETCVDQECSIGDYVLSGGEFPAMVLIDAITRLLPGALGHQASSQLDSFSFGLLDYPHYTRPENIDGLPVPKVLVEGDHRAIERWRLKQSLGKTWQKRPDLLKRRVLTAEEESLLDEYKKEVVFHERDH